MALSFAALEALPLELRMLLITVLHWALTAQSE